MLEETDRIQEKEVVTQAEQIKHTATFHCFADIQHGQEMTERTRTVFATQSALSILCDKLSNGDSGEILRRNEVLMYM